MGSLLGGLYPPQQFFDDTGGDNYKVFTGNVQERTATLNRLADQADALLDEREPPPDECPMCGKQLTGNGWQHPDLECEDHFQELAAEFYLAQGRENVGAEACSKACWEEFVSISQGDEREPPAEVICGMCQGDGFVSVGEGLFTCPACHGERFVPAALAAAVNRYLPYPVCGGGSWASRQLPARDCIYRRSRRG